MVNLLSEFRNMRMVEGYDQRRIIVIALIASIVNLVLGSLAAFVTQPFVNGLTILLVIFPFLITIIYLASVWLTWKGYVRQAFNLLIGVFLLQTLVYALTTKGYGLILGVASFVIASVVVVEVAPPHRWNKVMLMAGAVGTLAFLLDYYGPQGRLQASGIMLKILPVLVILLVLIYCIILIRLYPRLSLPTKLIIPIVMLTYISIGVLTAYNLYGSLNILQRMINEKPAAVADETLMYLAQLMDNHVRTNALLAVVVTFGATVIIASLAKWITRPVRMLTDAAQKLASGKLNSHVRIKSQDEIGSLADTFNLMATQLRQTLGNLEQRVVERTRDLAMASQQAESRAKALETVAEIGRAISSIRELDELLPFIANILSERFGYYHVGIFLLDPKRENLVLRAVNSGLGQELLDRGFSQKVNLKNVVGSVVINGAPRFAYDHGEQKIYFETSDFPETCSEAALPLIWSGLIVGVLDVHRKESSEFTPETKALLNLLADQISVAIENAQLFSETLRSLAELQSLQRKYVQDEWSKQTKDIHHLGYKYHHGVISPAQEISIFNDRQFMDALRKNGQHVREPLRLIDSQGDTKPSKRQDLPSSTPELTIPIILRGELIGVIQLAEIDPNRTWSEDEITLVQAVAVQVGLALENARLLEETQLRAEREATVTHITSQLRSSNDPNEILQIAMNELRLALKAQSTQIVLPEQPRSPVVEEQTKTGE